MILSRKINNLLNNITYITNLPYNKKPMTTSVFACWTSSPSQQHPVEHSGHMPCERRDVNLLNCQVTSRWSDEQRIMWLGVHWSYGNTMYLICHVASYDHIIKRSCKYMGGSSFRYITILTRLVMIGKVIV